MFEHATEAPHGRERRRETSTVVPRLETTVVRRAAL
jgi:hypothetical protein